MKEINQIVNRIATHSDSLYINVDNNACEQFNSVINKHIGGKRINFSQRNSYNTRVEAAVVSYNSSGQYLRKMCKQVNKVSPGEPFFFLIYRTDQFEIIILIIKSCTYLNI